MTMRTKQPLVCQCGHQGYVCCSENDQPYSGLWESYSLEGFQGGAVTVTRYDQMPSDLLAALAPRCPHCGEAGRARYADA